MMDKVLSVKAFIFSQVFILILGLTIILGIYYIVNQGETTHLYSPTGGPVTSAPATLTLDLSSPEPDLLSFQPTIIVSGKSSSQSNVLISSETQDIVVLTKNDGSFSSSFNLDEGVNNITVTVFNSTGDTRTQQRSVFYSKEKI